MRKTFTTFAFLALAVASTMTQAQASTRSFFTPTVAGDRLSFCLVDRQDCGKPIADAWCRAVGFQEVLNYQRDHSTTRQFNVARYADTGGICTGTNCESFRQIKCWRKAES